MDITGYQFHNQGHVFSPFPIYCRSGTHHKKYQSRQKRVEESLHGMVREIIGTGFEDNEYNLTPESA
jgi:hypothetical protein